MKILLVAETPDFGGVLTALNNVLLVNSSQRIQTDIYFEGSDISSDRIFCDSNIKKIKIKRSRLCSKLPFSIVWEFFFLLKILKQKQFDLIIVKSCTPRRYFGFLFFKIPTLFFCHTMPIKKQMWSIDFLFKLMNKKNFYFIAPSIAARNKVHNLYGVSSDLIRVLPTGVRSQLNEKIEDRQSQKKQILTIGHLDWYKDPWFWLDIVEKTVLISSDIHFVWIGEGPLQDMVDREIERRGLKNSVKICKYHSDLSQFWRETTIYLHTSYFESQGLAVIEAMANGLPVISPNIDGVNESVIDNQTGVLLDTRNPEDYANEIVRLLDQKKICSQLGLNGHKRYKELFDIEIFHKNLLDLYTKVMS